MLYNPKGYKFIKIHKKKSKAFGSGFTIKNRYGIISRTFGLITSRQLETLRRYISRRLQKRSKAFRRVSLTSIITKKSNKARMGKGMGKFNRWVGYIRPGIVLFEFSELKQLDINSNISGEFSKLQSKLPFKCKFIFYSIDYKII